MVGHSLSLNFDIKNTLIKFNYTEEEIDKELNNMLKNRINNGRYILWHFLILMAMSKAFLYNNNFRKKFEKNDLLSTLKCGVST